MVQWCYDWAFRPGRREGVGIFNRNVLTQVGFSGEQEPRSVFPTVVTGRRHRHRHLDGGDDRSGREAEAAAAGEAGAAGAGAGGRGAAAGETSAAGATEAAPAAAPAAVRYEGARRVPPLPEHTVVGRAAIAQADRVELHWCLSVG